MRSLTFEYLSFICISKHTNVLYMNYEYLSLVSAVTHFGSALYYHITVSIQENTVRMKITAFVCIPFLKYTHSKALLLQMLIVITSPNCSFTESIKFENYYIRF